MLLSITDNNNQYTIVPKGDYADANVYTVLIGKNGSGKSRILKRLADFSANERQLIATAQSKKFTQLITNAEINKIKYIGNIPSKVICVSTSPFDRFTTPKKTSPTNNHYHYLGIRELPNTNIGKEYLGKIMYSLLNRVSKNPEAALAISKTLSYLDFEDDINIVLKLTSPAFCNDLLKHSQLSVSDFKKIPNKFNIGKDIKRASELSEILNYNRGITASSSFELSIKINSSGIHYINKDSLLLESNSQLLSLIKHNFIKIKEISLKQKNNFKRLRLEDASSGQQSIVMSLLAISAQIEDGSLICIDEPEVCLHPEWQEKYIELLTASFDYYKNCQFIIATHSPQIIANLPRKTCFITQMGINETLSSHNYYQRSADYQLAKLFKAPGHNNEFLNRTAITLFARVSKNKNFSENDLESLRFLIDIKEIIHATDPLIDLISALQDMKRTYG